MGNNKKLLVSTLNGIADLILKEKEEQKSLAKQGKGWQNREFCNSVDEEMILIGKFGEIANKLREQGCDAEVKKVLKEKKI
jgi:rRNA pseudouridine-1189 N-methylase Emg1 (Nep1/Mra1 family)